MFSEAKPARRNSSMALERLRAIIDQRERDGLKQLPTERELAEGLGIGRRAVRRALEVLEEEGRIWRRQGAGTFVGAEPHRADHRLKKLPEVTNMLEVMEVRLRLEPVLAQLAALRATPADLARMRSLAAKVAAADDLDGRELWDSALHRAIATAAGNALFLALFDVVDRVRQDDTWRHVREALRTEERLSLYTAQHDAVLDAIERRDPATAEKAMRQHLLALQERLLLQTSGALADAS